jgi:hypothetical protein
MTENYGAKKKTCLKYFTENFDINSYDKNKQEEIKAIFSSFYKYLTSENEILKHNTAEINKYFKKCENLDATFEDTAKVTYKYYKTKTKQREVYTRGKRKTKQERYFTDELNNAKFNTSIRANYIQSLDACLVR